MITTWVIFRRWNRVKIMKVRLTMNAVMTEIIANQALIIVSLLGIVYQNFPDCFDKKKSIFTRHNRFYDHIWNICCQAHQEYIFFYSFFHCSIVFRKIWRLSIFLHAWWIFSISGNTFQSSSPLEICENRIEKHCEIMDKGPR